MDIDTTAKYIVGIVLFVAVVSVLMLIITSNVQTPLTGQVYSIKTKPVTCGDVSCQNWESETTCPEDCSQSEVTGSAIQLGGRGRRYIEDAG